MCVCMYVCMYVCVIIVCIIIILQPFHVSIFATLTSEVSIRVIMDKVGSASGSKSNIKS